MKRDRNVQLLLLRQIRDRISSPQLESLSKEARVFNSALLIQEGRVEGSIHNDHTGQPSVVILRSLTNFGHDLLEELEASPEPPKIHFMKSTILFLASNPDGGTKLALDQECREIREKIRASDFPTALELKSEWAVRPSDLLQYLNEYRPHIVHFSGHGSRTEEIILHSNSEQAQPVTSSA